MGGCGWRSFVLDDTIIPDFQNNSFVIGMTIGTH